MGLAAFDPDSSTGTREGGWGPRELQGYDPEEMAQAVIDLMQNKCLSHTCGVQGEWEVRTTLVADRQVWRYHSRVYRHGKEARKSFPPIDVIRTGEGRPKGGVIEEILTAFAREAVEVHFARYASVAEYAVMASIYLQPPSWYHGIKRVALILLSAAALLSVVAFFTADRWWRAFPIAVPVQSKRQPPPHHIQWQTRLVSYHSLAGQRFVFPLPTLERMPNEIPVDVTLEASGDEPNWVELDRERLQLRGTAPMTTADQTHQLIVRARVERGSDSRLLVILTIKGQPARIAPAPQLPGHWAW
jgi:hypothetical protein